jgi:hypothetical protein
MNTLLFSVVYLGTGALAAPLVATQFSELHRWSFYYLISVAVAMLNTVLLVCIFEFKTQDGKSIVIFSLNECIESQNVPPIRVFRADWSGR